MDYVELRCLVSKCLKIFPLSFCIVAGFVVVTVRKYTVYNFECFKSVLCPSLVRDLTRCVFRRHLERACVPLLHGGAFSECGLTSSVDADARFFCALADFCLRALSVVKSDVELSRVIVV